ncbi:MAG: S-adenosylmethionine:tRNA ribosyltransferase-isomerase, partial [Clostridiaceae bacterium]|nr:S-adenosylmethionine:tRNA ribosyltransferase-isomerase [Clostridiaceae bacterium]
MKLGDFYYDLPEELIAQEPIADRDMSRLLVIDKNNGEIEHRSFRDILEYLNGGDCLVLNNTRVIPARLFGTKKDSMGSIEFLLLNRKDKDTWEVMVRPGKRAKIGAVFLFGDGELEGEIIEILEGGNRLVSFSYRGIFEEVLDRLGNVPLPPYI